jgi:hypothetical protein
LKDILEVKAATNNLAVVAYAARSQSLKEQANIP